MKGLLVWSHSYCRSTLAFYEGLAKAFGVPLRVLLWQRGFANRTAVGYEDAEFAHLGALHIGEDGARARHELAAHADWHHLFGTYQKGALFRAMLLEARRAGCHVAIASEAPCNMARPPGFVLKALYLTLVLRVEVSRQVHAADFLLNLSGDISPCLRRVGWSESRMIPCGYYPPPLVGSEFCARTRRRDAPFCALMTGQHEWHRDPLVLLRALRILQQRGIRCQTVITGEGPLLPQMRAFAARHQLDVEFFGLAPLKRVIELYQTCSCFVATGRAEPWGIRVNDALHCGAPLVVSDGMGAAQLVRDYGCGMLFRRRDPRDLADKMQLLIADPAKYAAAAAATRRASEACLPHRKAAEMADVIRARYPQWR